MLSFIPWFWEISFSYTKIPDVCKDIFGILCSVLLAYLSVRLPHCFNYESFKSMTFCIVRTYAFDCSYFTKLSWFLAHISHFQVNFSPFVKILSGFDDNYIYSQIEKRNRCLQIVYQLWELWLWMHNLNNCLVQAASR